jgi:hypothetical protein
VSITAVIEVAFVDIFVPFAFFVTFRATHSRQSSRQVFPSPAANGATECECVVHSTEVTSPMRFLPRDSVYLALCRDPGHTRSASACVYTGLPLGFYCQWTARDRHSL